VDINPADLYYDCDVCVAKKTIWSLNNTAAGATGRFSKEAEIKTKFEVVFCLSFFMLYCLSVLNYRNINLADYLSVVFFNVYVTDYSQTLKRKKWSGLPPFPYSSNSREFKEQSVCGKSL